MLIIPQQEERLNGKYTFGFQTSCLINKQLNQPIFGQLWHGFCCHSGEITFSGAEELIIKIGEAKEIEQPESGYVLEVTENGICAAASDVKNLTYAFFALLERIVPVCTRKGEERFSVGGCRIVDDAAVKTRMVHLCIFPETELSFVRKFIRLAAFVRYTHLVVEFWGTLRYDCLKELAWAEHSYSKDEIRPLLQEAKALGLEIVPMFNLWGHAAASRIKTGKHVVLDQNLALAPLFGITGWEWNLSNPDTVALQKKICAELIELCGEGEYFHIGCDEAFSAFSNAEFEVVVDHINSVSEELGKYGRKAIMWGDMLLHKDTLNQQTENDYYLFCPNVELQKILLSKLSHSVIIADWQYKATLYPIETALFFKERGYEVLCCPWDKDENVQASAEMIREHGLKGVLHTTWNTLQTMRGLRAAAYSAALSWNKAEFKAKPEYQGCEIGALLRKLDFPHGEYADCGWMKQQL